jgi:hypothetical protein
VMVTRGRTHRLTELEALLAWVGEDRVGAATYRLDEVEAELLSLSTIPLAVASARPCSWLSRRPCAALVGVASGW